MNMFENKRIHAFYKGNIRQVFVDMIKEYPEVKSFFEKASINRIGSETLAVWNAYDFTDTEKDGFYKVVSYLRSNLLESDSFLWIESTVTLCNEPLIENFLGTYFHNPVGLRVIGTPIYRLPDKC